MSVSTSASTRQRRKCRSIPEYPPVFECHIAKLHPAQMNASNAPATEFVFRAARRCSAGDGRKQNALDLSAWVVVVPEIGWTYLRRQSAWRGPMKIKPERGERWPDQGFS